MTTPVQDWQFFFKGLNCEGTVTESCVDLSGSKWLFHVFQTFQIILNLSGIVCERRREHYPICLFTDVYTF